MGEETLRILLVEQDEDEYRLTLGLLDEGLKGRFDLQWAPTYEEAVRAVESGQHDVALVNLRLGDHDGLELLSHTIGHNCQVPVIILTERGDQKIELEALRSGAADCLDKDVLRNDLASMLLVRSVCFAVERAHMLEAQNQTRTEGYPAHTADLAPAAAAGRSEPGSWDGSAYL